MRERWETKLLILIRYTIYSVLRPAVHQISSIVGYLYPYLCVNSVPYQQLATEKIDCTYYYLLRILIIAVITYRAMLYIKCTVIFNASPVHNNFITIFIYREFNTNCLKHVRGILLQNERKIFQLFYYLYRLVT